MKKDDYKDLLLEKDKKYFNYQQIYRKPKKNVYMIFNEKNKNKKNTQKINSVVFSNKNIKIEKQLSTPSNDKFLNKSEKFNQNKNFIENNEKNNFENFTNKIKREKSPLNINLVNNGNLDHIKQNQHSLKSQNLKIEKSPFYNILEKNENMPKIEKSPLIIDNNERRKSLTNFQNTINREKSPLPGLQGYIKNTQNPKTNTNLNNFQNSIKREKSPLHNYMENTQNPKINPNIQKMKREKSPLPDYIKNTQNLKINPNKNKTNSFYGNSDMKSQNSIRNFLLQQSNNKSLNKSFNKSRKSLKSQRSQISMNREKSPLNVFLGNKSPRNSFSNISRRSRKSRKSLNSIREKSPLNIFIGKKSPRNSFSNISRKSIENEKMEKMGNNPIFLKTTILSKEAEIKFLKAKIADIYEPKKNIQKKDDNEIEYSINKKEINLINLKNQYKIQFEKNKEIKKKINLMENSNLEEFEQIHKSFDNLQNENKHSFEMEMQFKYKNNDEEIIRYLKNRIEMLKPKTGFSRFLNL